MPTYVYTCQNLNCAYPHHEVEKRGVPMNERDDQDCDMCGYPLTRKPRFTGSVWAPTAGGMR